MNVLAVVLTLAVAVSSTLLLVATRRAAGGGAGGPVHDISEAAFLNGGPARVVDTALAALHADGRLVVGGPGIVAVQRAEARDPVERAVLQELATAANGALHTLREAVMRHPSVQETGDGLAARGLLVPPGESRSRRRWAAVQGVLCVVAFPVCMVLTFAEFALRHDGDAPFPFIIKVLPAILAGSVTGIAVAASARNRITRAGRRAADAYRATHASATPAHLVATMGLGALPDPVLRAQLMAAARIRPAGRPSSAPAYSSADSFVPTTWCAGVSPGGGSCGSSSGGGGGGGGGGSSCSSGASCGGGSGGGSSCGSSGSSCGGGSSGGSSCGSSS